MYNEAGRFNELKLIGANANIGIWKRVYLIIESFRRCSLAVSINSEIDCIMIEAKIGQRNCYLWG